MQHGLCLPAAAAPACVPRSPAVPRAAHVGSSGAHASCTACVYGCTCLRVRDGQMLGAAAAVCWQQWSPLTSTCIMHHTPAGRGASSAKYHQVSPERAFEGCVEAYASQWAAPCVCVPVCLCVCVHAWVHCEAGACCQCLPQAATNTRGSIAVHTLRGCCVVSRLATWLGADRRCDCSWMLLVGAGRWQCLCWGMYERRTSPPLVGAAIVQLPQHA